MISHKDLSNEESKADIEILAMIQLLVHTKQKVDVWWLWCLINGIEVYANIEKPDCSHCISAPQCQHESSDICKRALENGQGISTVSNALMLYDNLWRRLCVWMRTGEPCTPCLSECICIPFRLLSFFIIRVCCFFFFIILCSLCAGFLRRISARNTHTHPHKMHMWHVFMHSTYNMQCTTNVKLNLYHNIHNSLYQNREIAMAIWKFCIDRQRKNVWTV